MNVKNEKASILRAHAERAVSANAVEKFISNYIRQTKIMPKIGDEKFYFRGILTCLFFIHCVMKKYMVLILIIVLLFIIPLRYKNNESKPAAKEEECKIFITLAGSNEKIELEQYLMGVLAGEMPASFHIEALKAQAVAARTYAIHQTNYGATPTQQTTAHQVYKEAINPKYEDKLKEAVSATKHRILTYNNQPITAMFHAASNGRTESAQNFSGAQIAYLTTVSTPEEYVEVQTFTLAKFNEQLKTTYTLTQIAQAQIMRNDTNRVERITIGQNTWTGREFRDLLQLKSTDFTINVNNEIEIQTKGYGHGVGMSQYGANELASNGRSAQQILAHYYPDTTLIKLACSKE